MQWAMCDHGHSHWGRLGAAGLLLARDGRALVQLRAGWVHRGGTWALPGGARERGESAAQAALREAEEELGIDAAHVEVRGTRPADCGGWVYETVLGTVVGEPHVRDRSESAGHRWVPVAEVADLPLHPAFRTAWSHPDGVLRDFVAGTFTPG
jgi:8-oxo-dGTP pyrophosphatase MutT (NUDIX family)